MRLPRMRVLVGGVVALIAAHFTAAALRLEFGVRSDRWTSLFDLDAESNVPTWFASFLLLAAAWHCSDSARRDPSLVVRRGLLRLGAVFVALACDEVAMVHERVAAALLDAARANAIPPWTVWALGGVLALAIATAFVPLLRALPRAMSRSMVIAGAVFVAGAVGVESIAHAYARAHGFANWTYVMLSAVEESCEFGGVIVFIRVMETHARRANPSAPSDRPGAVRMDRS